MAPRDGAKYRRGHLRSQRLVATRPVDETEQGVGDGRGHGYLLDAPQEDSHSGITEGAESFHGADQEEVVAVDGRRHVLHSLLRLGKLQDDSGERGLDLPVRRLAKPGPEKGDRLPSQCRIVSRRVDLVKDCGGLFRPAGLRHRSDRPSKVFEDLFLVPRREGDEEVLSHGEGPTEKVLPCRKAGGVSCPFEETVQNGILPPRQQTLKAADELSQVPSCQRRPLLL